MEYMHKDIFIQYKVYRQIIGTVDWWSTSFVYITAHTNKSFVSSTRLENTQSTTFNVRIIYSRKQLPGLLSQLKFTICVRCDMAFIKPMHSDKSDFTFLLFWPAGNTASFIKTRRPIFSRNLKTTRTTRTPPNDYPYHWVILDPKWKEDKVKVTNLKHSPKFQIFEFWNRHYARHTFWSCLIRCANMKWIRWVLLKIQSGHDSVHRRTDGQGDTSIPPFNFVEAGGIINEKPCYKATWTYIR